MDDGDVKSDIEYSAWFPFRVKRQRHQDNDYYDDEVGEQEEELRRVIVSLPPPREKEKPSFRKLISTQFASDTGIINRSAAAHCV